MPALESDGVYHRAEVTGAIDTDFAWAIGADAADATFYEQLVPLEVQKLLRAIVISVFELADFDALFALGDLERFS